VVNCRAALRKAADNIEALLPLEARAITENRCGAEMIVIAAFNNLDIAIKERTARRYKEEGATKMLNQVALQTFVAGLKTALRQELLKAMPGKIIEAYRQALALERITVKQKKQFVSV
jgi:hypothetical protein